MDTAVRERAKKQANLCRVFGNACRILIVWTLIGRELSVTEIAEEVGTSLQNISQHLAVLKRQDIVVARRERQTIYYRIADNEWLQDLPILLKSPQRNLIEK
jgi:DNA-binding transcriptional ArsR family regulator